ncbi:MAG: class II glutamine amidotransferase [Rhizobiales bacterium]|nr:class II glutamine amidotransferase [Hyphomicrobiales bacterium]
MCRWLAYRGRPRLMEALVTQPQHSLIAQSLHADESKATTNGDGFGVGWYGERPQPGLYREVRPAWSDENLRSICAQVRSPMFFAHVRASTGTAIARANCHPFAHGRHMFMHNGQIGGYARLKRRIEAMIPDELYDARGGATDSEALFLIALSRGLAEQPVAALASTLRDVAAMMREAGIEEALRFTAAVSDGEQLVAVRWASDEKAPSLYHRDDEGDLIVVSEPLDTDRACWRPVPQGCALIARPDAPVEVRCMNEAMRQAA